MTYFTNTKAPTLARTYDASISSSTAITLNTATKYIEVTSLLKGAFMKWGGTASSSDFDEFIAPDITRTYVVPDGVTTVEFIEQAASGALICIEK
jgi:hypothetical protein